MNLFTFITSNSEKISTARIYLDPLGIEFDSRDIDLIEPQIASVEEISKFKAKQAFDILKAPVVVSDHGWAITALNGFPGPYMKFINKWFGTDDFLRLLAGYEDRSVVKTEVISYADQNGVKSFAQEIPGLLLTEPKGEGLPMMKLTTFLSSQKSVAECLNEGIDPTNGKLNLWKDFSEWLCSK